MRLSSFPYLRRIGTGIMLGAVAAFLLQTAMVIVSQAAASIGSMPHPAVTLSGAVHFHDNLAANVHTHVGDNAVGHSHEIPDGDHHDIDDATHTPLWSFGSTSAVLPVPVALAVLLSVVSAGAIAQDPLVGIEPGRLSRPPSTPSIA